MRVEVHIDPDCREPRADHHGPVLTDEIRDLAARLEGGGGLTAGGARPPCLCGRRRSSDALPRIRG